MLPENLLDKYLNRFDELIKQGEEIKRNIKFMPGANSDTWDRGIPATSDREEIDEQKFKQWKINCLSLLDKVIPLSSIHRSILAKYEKNFYSQNVYLKDF